MLLESLKRSLPGCDRKLVHISGISHPKCYEMQIIPRVSVCFASPMSPLPCLLPIQRAAIRNEEDGMVEWVQRTSRRKQTLRALTYNYA